MYALNTYIDNTLARTDYNQDIDYLHSLQVSYRKMWSDLTEMEFTIIEVEPWQYPNSPDKAMNEITEESF